MTSFFEDELQQMMWTDPVLIYRRIWWWDEVEIKAAAIFPRLYSVSTHFGFVVFDLWVNSDIYWQLDKAYWVIPKSVLGLMSSGDWLENMTSVWQDTRFLASLIWRPILLVKYMFVRICFQIINYHFPKKIMLLFRSRLLTTIRRMDEIWRRGE